MRAGALVMALALLVLVVPAGAQHGGGGHSSGHFGGIHFGGRHGHGKASHWISGRGGQFSGAPLTRMPVPARITTFVGFGSVPGFRIFFVTDGFFCPFTPHFISPFCPVCSLGFFGPFSFHHGFFGFSSFGFVDGFSQTAVDTTLPAGTSDQRLPVLVFTNGWSFEVTDYWIDEEGELRYLTPYGGMTIVGLQSLDLYATAKRNADRGIAFTLKLQHQR